MYYVGVVAESWFKNFSYAGLAAAAVLGVASMLVIKNRAKKAHAKAEAAAAETPDSVPAE